jgi:hypothetical protein
MRLLIVSNALLRTNKIASLPGGIIDIEKFIVNEINENNYRQHQQGALLGINYYLGLSQMVISTATAVIPGIFFFILSDLAQVNTFACSDLFYLRLS